MSTLFTCAALDRFLVPGGRLSFILRQATFRSAQSGELVMDRLKKVDEVSYVRFASVYRQFKDINTFLDELNKLLEDK